MELNPIHITPNFNYEIVYSEHYNNHDRIRVKTDRTNKYGKVYIMLSRVNKPIHFHLYFENGLYFKYNKTTKKQTEINEILEDIITTFYAKVMNRIYYLEKRDTLGLPMFFLYLDKFLYECEYNKAQTKETMIEFYNQQKPYNKFMLFQVMAKPMAIMSESDFLSRFLKALSRLSVWFWDIPSVVGYTPKLSLETYTLYNSKFVSIKKLPYEEFLKTIDGLNEEDILILLAHYGVNLKDYHFYANYDIKRKLYIHMHRHRRGSEK
jgi:hypothetical protein